MFLFLFLVLVILKDMLIFMSWLICSIDGEMMRLLNINGEVGVDFLWLDLVKDDGEFLLNGEELVVRVYILSIVVVI